MKTFKICNPSAGSGKKNKIDTDCYFTKSPGDCKRFISEEITKNESSHFIVYGGDGTINEAVCALAESPAKDSACLTFIPAGSGNDTVKSIPNSLGTKEGIYPLDVIKFNDSYSVNMINIGFDCNVVSSASKFKRKFKISGKISYILGVITEFFKPFGETFEIDATLVNGEKFSFKGDCLLCAVCNGEWCGGSFHNSPISRMNDGVIELLLVKKMSRIGFLKLVGKYKKGTLFDNTGKITLPKFTDKVSYLKIKEMEISGLKRICSDGEVTPCTCAKITVLPNFLRYKV